MAESFHSETKKNAVRAANNAAHIENQQAVNLFISNDTNNCIVLQIFLNDNSSCMPHAC